MGASAERRLREFIDRYSVGGALSDSHSLGKGFASFRDCMGAPVVRDAGAPWSWVSGVATLEVRRCTGYGRTAGLVDGPVCEERRPTTNTIAGFDPHRYAYVARIRQSGSS